MESYRTLKFFDDIRTALKPTKNPNRSFGSEITNLKSSINHKLDSVLDENTIPAELKFTNTS